MPHPQHTYPVMTCPVHPVWTVCEPKPDDDLTVLLDFTDRINERLAKAEALTRLLIDNEAALTSLPDAAWAIADLIAETRALHTRQWERIRRRLKTK
jgi:hypothetical protein